MKTCNKCKTNKSIEDFYNNRASKDGKTAWCKECYKEKDRKKTHPKRKVKPKPEKLEFDYHLQKEIDDLVSRVEADIARLSDLTSLERVGLFILHLNDLNTGKRLFEEKHYERRY
jgi:hypothetical protein